MNSQFPQFIPPVQSRGKPGSGNMAVSIDAAPYPEVTGERDPATVALLKEDYAGAQGELTGVLQYVYQSIKTGDSYADFANALLQIAIVEMTHLDMLGDAIETLGGSPSFDDGKFYWDASKVNYAAGFKAMLEANIAAEEEAIASYTAHAAQTKNPSVTALLERIIQDEKLHLRFFTDTLAGI